MLTHTYLGKCIGFLKILKLFDISYHKLEDMQATQQSAYFTTVPLFSRGEYTDADWKGDCVFNFQKGILNAVMSS